MHWLVHSLTDLLSRAPGELGQCQMRCTNMQVTIPQVKLFRVSELPCRRVTKRNMLITIWSLSTFMHWLFVVHSRVGPYDLLRVCPFEKFHWYFQYPCKQKNMLHPIICSNEFLTLASKSQSSRTLQTISCLPLVLQGVSKGYTNDGSSLEGLG